MKRKSRSQKRPAMTASTMCAFALFSMAAPTNANADVEIVGALHHGRIEGKNLHWESQFVFHDPGSGASFATLTLLRPLPKSARIEGADLDVTRTELTAPLKWVTAIRGPSSRVAKVSVFEPAPRSGTTLALSLPLAGAPVERVTADGFTLEPVDEHGVQTYVGMRIASGVSKKARRRLERLARGAAPAGALYLGPTDLLKLDGLEAKFVDVKVQRRNAAMAFGGLGLGLTALLGGAFMVLAKHAKREQASAILNTDLDELVEIAERHQGGPCRP